VAHSLSLVRRCASAHDVPEWCRESPPVNIEASTVSL